MKNYKINIDKPKPTQDEILAGRNFDDLLKQYNASPGKIVKKPFWQTGGFIGSVAAVAATVAIVLMVMKNSNNNPVTDETQGPVIVDNGNVVDTATPDNTNNNNVAWTPTKRKIAPPLKGVNVPYRQYKVSAKSGGSISYPTGTKIKFQPNSFVDKNGNPVTGNVEIQYREMHDAADFFVAGVPLEYDSAGQTYIFESAGMLEVAAFINGQVVYLDKNKPMQVEMASAQSGSNYNLYQFDSVAGNWVYLGKDKVAPMPEDKNKRKKDSLEAYQNWLALQNKFRPVCGGNHSGPPRDAKRPLKADPSKNRFVVDFNKSEFPELASYANVIFEVDETKEKFDAANYNVTWDLITLGNGQKEASYNLTLKKGLKTVKLDVYPVLDGQEYANAFANYEAAHAKYLKDSAAYVEYTVLRNTPNNGIVDNSGALLPFSYDPEMQATMQMEYNVARSFQLSGMGTFNIDSPELYPQGAVLEFALNGPDNKPFEGFYFSHVDRQKNTLMTYTNPTSAFYVNTRSQNTLWAVKDGELYYADNASFAGLPSKGKATITLRKVMKKLNTVEEIRAFFNLKAPKAS